MAKRKLRVPSLERATKLLAKSRKALGELAGLEREFAAKKATKLTRTSSGRAIGATKHKLKMPALDLAIKLLEKDPNAFQFKVPAREGKRFLASLKKLDARVARKRT